MELRISYLEGKIDKFYKEGFQNDSYQIKDINNFLLGMKSDNHLNEFLNRLDKFVSPKNINSSHILAAFVNEFIFLKILEEDFLKTDNLYIIDYSYDLNSYVVELKYNTLIYETKEVAKNNFVENYTKTYNKIIIDDGMYQSKNEVSIDKLNLNFYKLDYVDKHYHLCNQLMNCISSYLLKKKLSNEYRLDELISNYFQEDNYLTKSLIFLSQIKAKNYYDIYDKKTIHNYNLCIFKLFNKKIYMLNSTNGIGYIKSKYKELKFLEINKRYENLLPYINSNILAINQINKEFDLLLKSLIIDYLTEVNNLFIVDSEDKMIHFYVDSLFDKINDLKEFFVFIDDFKHDNIQEINRLLNDRVLDENNIMKTIESKKIRHKEVLNKLTK